MAVALEVNPASSLVNRAIDEKVKNRNRDLTNLTERNRVSFHEIPMGKAGMANTELEERSLPSTATMVKRWPQTRNVQQ